MIRIPETNKKGENSNKNDSSQTLKIETIDADIEETTNSLDNQYFQHQKIIKERKLSIENTPSANNLLENEHIEKEVFPNSERDLEKAVAQTVSTSSKHREKNHPSSSADSTFSSNNNNCIYNESEICEDSDAFSIRL